MGVFIFQVEGNVLGANNNGNCLGILRTHKKEGQEGEEDEEKEKSGKRINRLFSHRCMVCCHEQLLLCFCNCTHSAGNQGISCICLEKRAHINLFNATL